MLEFVFFFFLVLSLDSCKFPIFVADEWQIFLLKIEHWYYTQSSINSNIIFQVWFSFWRKSGTQTGVLDFCTKYKSFCSKFKWFKLQNSSYSYSHKKKFSYGGFLARVVSKVIMWLPSSWIWSTWVSQQTLFVIHFIIDHLNFIHPNQASIYMINFSSIYIKLQASIYIIKKFIHVFDGITVIYIYILNWLSFLHSFIHSHDHVSSM